MSLKFAADVMAMPMPDVDERNFVHVLRLKQQIAQSVLTTTARVRDQILRPANDDDMEVVFAALRKARGETP